MEQPKHINRLTPDGTELNLEALYRIVPSCFTEALGDDGELHRVIDFNKLRLLLGDNAIDDAPEVYDFTWVGKRAALKEAAAPITKTLRPCPEESVNWDTTQNLYIEGDNLEVLKLLQNSYMGKVKMIYIDPPYNTGNDFVYHDDFAQSAEEYDEANRDDEGNRFRKNTDSNGRFHSDWCSMIYARLMVARNLLTEDGVIFISIDDNEVENLKKVCDEILGEKNFIGQWNWFKSATPPNLSKKIKKNIEYVICYQKGGNNNVFTGIKKTSSSDDPITKPQNTYKELTFKPGWIHAKFGDGVIKAGTYGTNKFPNELLNDLIIEDGVNKNEVTFRNRFIWIQDTLRSQIENGTRINLSKALVISYKKAEYSAEVPPNLIDDSVGVDTTEQAGNDLEELFNGRSFFDYPKPVSLIHYLIDFDAPCDNSLILDFFSGSATTAHAVMQLNAEDGGNRKFIMVQWPEETPTDSGAFKAGYKNICEIGKERIRRAGQKIVETFPETSHQHDLFDNVSETFQETSLPDIGFRVFKCEDSNYKEVALAPKDYDQSQLEAFVDNIKDDRTDLDLLFDCMLRWGVELSLPLATTTVDGCTIHNVNDGDLVACFDGKVTEAVIEAIAQCSPVRVVFRDSSFTEAAQKMNLFELFKQHCDWTDEEVRNNVRVI